MKKLIPVAGLLLLPLIAFTKTGFFLKPAIGFGITNTMSKNFLMPIDGNNILSAEYELSAGFQANRIAISAGIGYLTTGYEEKRFVSFSFDPFTGTPASSGTLTAKSAFRHLLVPIHISYTIPFNRFSLVPEAGVDAMYNIGKRSRGNGFGKKSSRFISGSDFHYAYSKFSLMGSAQLNVQFQATRSISVYGGPGIKYMLTNLLTKNVSTANDAREYHYAILMQAGVIYHF